MVSIIQHTGDGVGGTEEFVRGFFVIGYSKMIQKDDDFEPSNVSKLREGVYH